jgi:hypothetical protein
MRLRENGIKWKSAEEMLNYSDSHPKCFVFTHKNIVTNGMLCYNKKQKKPSDYGDFASFFATRFDW